MDNPDVSIIIVNYNTADLIGACIESLGRDRSSQEVFVVDNASTDGGVEVIRSRYPWVHLTVNAENRGFAAANNQVLPLCRGRYLFFLNPDVWLSGANVIETCVRFMDVHPQIGLSGTKLLYPDGTRQESKSERYPGQQFAGSQINGLSGTIAWVMGASMFARTNLIRRLGGFDENFVLYGEDQDLCLRIRRAGFEIGYIEDAAVFHYGGQSERQSTTAEIWTKKTRAEYRFYRKHYRSETVARIRRADRRKAHFRLLTLALSWPFLADRTEAEAKRTKYRALRDVLRSLNSERKI